MSGKGDKRRPTDEAAYGDGWDRIFGGQGKDVSAKEGEASGCDGNCHVEQEVKS